MIHFIIQPLQQLTTNNESGFRDCIRMLDFLSSQRIPELAIEEKEEMRSQVTYYQPPSFNIGMKQGLMEGKFERDPSGIRQFAQVLIFQSIPWKIGP